MSTFAAFRESLEAVRADLFRVKGFLRAGGGMHLVDVSPAGITIEPDPRE